VANHARHRVNSAERRLHQAADRLLLRMARHGAHWTALLAVTSVTGAVADTLLPATAGHTVDLVLRSVSGPGQASGTPERASYWLAGFPTCIILGFGLNMQGFGIWIGLAFGLFVAAALLVARFWYLSRDQIPGGASWGWGWTGVSSGN